MHLQPLSPLQVFSPTKDHALYLWIHLKDNASAKACAKAVVDIQVQIKDYIYFYITLAELPTFLNKGFSHFSCECERSQSSFKICSSLIG